jgi:L-2-hydroxyglutarate oxidase
MLGLGTDLCDLNFRGEYWEIGEEWRSLAARNIYTVAQHPELPFLDPHWIVRADGRCEIGPNAVPVAGPYTYKGFFTSPGQAVRKMLEKPIANKLALLYNRDFLELAGREWLSSISKGEMAKRAQEFIPELKVEYLVKPGIAGVRAQVIDRRGNFLKEAVQFEGPLSFHIVNYNSPGATGSPAFAAWIANKLAIAGHLDNLTHSPRKGRGVWDYDTVVGKLNA